MPKVGPDTWAVDDVSFLKDGKMSVAVAHQYCGVLGKQAGWDGVLAEVSLVVEWPAVAEAPTGYWLSNLPV